ncbi:protein DOG1-like 3 [Silene latifolia]|uniref:protein DOG1-like 3 n=1 Tax=Silene latifolia TaxID=37657 RepID=UPI003D78AF9B
MFNQLAYKFTHYCPQFMNNLPLILLTIHQHALINLTLNPSTSNNMTIQTQLFVPTQDTTQIQMTTSDTRHSNTTPGPDHFGHFFETWLGEQNRDLEALIAAVESKPESTQSQPEWTRSVSELVSRVMRHYENYYRVKSESVRNDVVHMMTPAWRSHLEDAFLWIGGWRPTMAFHLLYSIAGLQLEAGLSELLQGLSTDDLADLSPTQLDRIDELQRQTLREEKALTESLAAHQETVADSAMVELSHLATEVIRSDSVTRDANSVRERVDSELAGKEEKLGEIVREADHLRLKTLKDVVGLLDPVQAAHYLIAAAELHLRVHEWGKKKDGYGNGNGVVRPANRGVGPRLRANVS